MLTHLVFTDIPGFGFLSSSWPSTLCSASLSCSSLRQTSPPSSSSSSSPTLACTSPSISWWRSWPGRGWRGRRWSSSSSPPSSCCPPSTSSGRRWRTQVWVLPCQRDQPAMFWGAQLLWQPWRVALSVQVKRKMSTEFQIWFFFSQFWSLLCPCLPAHSGRWYCWVWPGQHPSLVITKQPAVASKSVFFLQYWWLSQKLPMILKYRSCNRDVPSFFKIMI